MVERITFLGTGGGRHTTMYQSRCTGGMLFEHGDPTHYLHIDPGPGALTQMNRIHYDLGLTESLIISHAHPDHYSDAPSVIEGMTRGGWEKKGHVYGSPTVVDGVDGLGPCLSKYHLGLPISSSSFVPGDVLDIEGMKVDICKAKHSDPYNVGFRFHTPFGMVSYLSDTEYTQEIGEQYLGSRALILPVTTPHENRIHYHMCTDDAIEIAELVKPELCIFIHAGIVMLRQDPDRQAKMVEDATGVRTVSARDLDVLDIETLEISKAKTYDDEMWFPDWAPDMPEAKH
jgi:phosphoribosyl 1,2-cyclic phosphodiesterase